MSLWTCPPTRPVPARRKRLGYRNGAMAGTEIRPADKLLAKRVFVDFPFRLHGTDANWVPPLRLSVYDRLSRRHPASQHQRWALWTAHRGGQSGRPSGCSASIHCSTNARAKPGAGSVFSTRSMTKRWPDRCSTWPSTGPAGKGPRRPSGRPTSPPTTSSGCWSRASTPRLPCSPSRTPRTTRTCGWGPAGNR